MGFPGGGGGAADGHPKKGDLRFGQEPIGGAELGPPPAWGGMHHLTLPGKGARKRHTYHALDCGLEGGV